MQSYLWRARFLNAGGVGPWTEWSRFTVGSSGALAVTLREPADSATGVPIDLTLGWEAAPSATYYRIQLSDSTSFDSTFIDIDGIEETSTAIGPLNYESRYFWRVAGKGPDGKSTFSAPFSFTTIMAAPQAAMLLSPADGEEGVPAYAPFSWREQEDVQSYALEVALDSLFSQVVVSLTLQEATYTVDVPFDYDTPFYWRVRATNEGGEGPWSATWRFRTAIGTGIAGPDDIPSRFALNQNYPNPFNPNTTLVFELPEPAHTSIEVFSALGRRVATLIDEVVPAGRHRVVFNAADMPSGRYLVRMRAGSFEQSRLTTLSR
jgi:hypothetical protein